jgi:two-component system sensor histidine kinase SenX3
MLRPADADLRDVVSEAVDMAKTLADTKHKIRLDNPEKRVPVRMDADRVKTIVSNLIANAIKYSPDGGRVEVELTARGGIARVSVKDKGVGIAKEDLPVLFTRFGRISTPQTNHLPGTGLGLYLGRQLARLHGGEITVESEPGQGSTFTLHLPLSAQPPTAPREARLSAAATRSTPNRR